MAFFFSLSFWLICILFFQNGGSYGSQTLHGLLIQQTIRIPSLKNWGSPLRTMLYLGWQRGILKLLYCSKTLFMTSEGLVDVFEGYLTDMCTVLLLLLKSVGAKPPFQGCQTQEARIPISMSRNVSNHVTIITREKRKIKFYLINLVK